MDETIKPKEMNTAEPADATFEEVLGGVTGRYLASDGKTWIKFSLNHGTTPEEAKRIISGNGFSYGKSNAWD
jgi:hypothetical protein